MHKRFSAFAKRALAFTLAMVLLIALVPVSALAEQWAADTDFDVSTSFKSYITGLQFSSSDSDLVFEDDQPYDWKVRFQHSFAEKSISPTITATVVDSKGNQIDSYSRKGTLQAFGRRFRHILFDGLRAAHHGHLYSLRFSHS